MKTEEISNKLILNLLMLQIKNEAYLNTILECIKPVLAKNEEKDVESIHEEIIVKLKKNQTEALISFTKNMQVLTPELSQILAEYIRNNPQVN